MNIVLSVGGSAVIPDCKPNLHFLKALAKLVGDSGHSFGILVGGGPPARIYANAIRELGGSEFQADRAAVTCTRANAELVLAALGDLAPGQVFGDFEAAACAARGYKAVVMGGTIPGITTDSDAVLLAEAIGAKRLVNISNVEAVYDSDPRKNIKAKRFASLTFEGLNALASASDKRTAGTNFVFDMLACRLLARSKIEGHFVSWKKLGDVGNAIEGKRHSGTVVKE